MAREAGTAAPAAKPGRMGPLRRRRLRLVLGFAVLSGLLAAGALWLRDSELVGVQEVTVTGIEGRQAEEIRAALTAAARDMTTLHIRTEELLAAADRFPIVRSVRAEADFPDALRIRVNSRTPVAAVETGSRRTAAAGDGTLLPGTSAEGLPVVRLKAAPGAGRVTDERTIGAVRLLDAAPSALRKRVARVFVGGRGLTATMREGPKLYFGESGRPRAKWMAAAAVLADEGAHGATYVDVRLPERPGVGGLAPVPQPSTSTLG